ncbi:MAG: serine/threonine protein kinase [Synechococcaceae cyanobacterium]|nr:serine/threonine protein kinase [Synechococcaceae cyanobacterium]
MDPTPGPLPLEALLERIETELLPGLRIVSPSPHDPVVVESLPEPWQNLGSGNYAAVVLHPQFPELVVKIYAPGRAGLEEEAEVYRRIGQHRAYSECHHVGESYLVLRRLRGHTLWDCFRHGIPIPPQVIRDVDAALAYASGRGLNGHDVHGRNVMLQEGRGLVVDISDFLNPEPCSAWRDLRWAYLVVYRPLLGPLRLRWPDWALDLVRWGYRRVRWLRSRLRGLQSWWQRVREALGWAQQS